MKSKRHKGLGGILSLAVGVCGRMDAACSKGASSDSVLGTVTIDEKIK